MIHLFSPLQIGRLHVSNRILMAPMTRSRADDAGSVGPLTAEYYAQRAGAGLIISVGVYPKPMGSGYVSTPGLVDAGHVAACSEVTTTVHRADGRIAAQITHAGRISDPSLLPWAAAPVAPSAARLNGATYTDQGPRPHFTPRALELHEGAAVIDNQAKAAQRAVEAAIDAVELHAGSCYLPIQFLFTGTNDRSDRYGGVQQRIRFVVETLEAMCAAVGAESVGLKITPETRLNDVADADPVATNTGLLRALHLAFLDMAPAPGSAVGHALLRPLFDPAYLAGVGFDRHSGEDLVRSGLADAIVFGQLFIANPDPPLRSVQGAALTTADPSTFYAGGPRGYVDYPPFGALHAGQASQIEVSAS
jgi:N-ethylmaleimide reductase